MCYTPAEDVPQHLHCAAFWIFGGRLTQLSYSRTPPPGGWTYGPPPEAALLGDAPLSLGGPASDAAAPVDREGGGEGAAGSLRGSGGGRSAGLLFPAGGIKKRKSLRGVASKHQRNKKAKMRERAVAVVARKATKAGRKAKRQEGRKEARDLY